MSSTWMPLYVGDYIKDTGHLSAAEHGAYMLLIMHYWQHEALPTDERKLARIARMSPEEWTDARDTVAEFFEQAWRHPRIEAELAKSKSMRSAKSASGARGATAKWGEPTAKDTRSRRLAEARQKGTHTKAQWDAILAACGARCVRCDAQGSTVKDHIIPIYQGGSDGILNIQPLCLSCNASKGPERIDHRPDEAKRLAKRLADACETPAPSPSPSPSTVPTEESRTVKTEDDNAPLRVASHPTYEFESGVIRLNARDMTAWRKAYRNLDLEAELLALSEWAGGCENWFHAVKGALAKRNREQRQAIEIARGQGPPASSGRQLALVSGAPDAYRSETRSSSPGYQSRRTTGVDAFHAGMAATLAKRGLIGGGRGTDVEPDADDPTITDAEWTAAVGH